MTARSSAAYANAMRILDLAALIGAFVLSAWLASDDARHMPFEEVLAIRIKLTNLALFLTLIAFWAWILPHFGLYQSYLYRSKPRDATAVISAISCCVLVVWILLLLFRINLVVASFLIDFWLLALGSSLSGRLFIRFLVRRQRSKGHNLRHLLIVGTSNRAIALARQ